jgi:hypothetical protein
VITAGWAFAVTARMFTATACGSNDAHLNPAVTLGFAVRAGNFGKLAPYVAAQLLGALAGAALVWLHIRTFEQWLPRPFRASTRKRFGGAIPPKKQVLERDGWRCQNCGSSTDLQVHHSKPRSQLGDDILGNLIAVCAGCHRKLHGGR